MKSPSLLSFLGLFLTSAAALSAQAAPGLKSIGISDVKAGSAVLESVKKSNNLNSLERVVQALDSQLIDRIHNTRKFEVISRSDLASIVKEKDFTGEALQVKGVGYLLVTTVDDFQDFEETATFAALGKSATKRVIRITAVGKIYDANSGKLLESANVTLSNKDVAENLSNSTKSGELSDALLIDIAKKLAEGIAARVVDVVYPARVVSKIDRQVTLNRGDGTGIAVGQTWEIFAQGQDLVDPDTGEILGREEVAVGSVKITRVLPKVAQGEVVEDTGIDKGAVARLKK